MLEAKGINEDGSVNRDLFFDLSVMDGEGESDFGHENGEILKAKLPVGGEVSIIVNSLEKKNLDFKLQISVS